MLLAYPGPRTTSTPPTISSGKNDVEWYDGSLVSLTGIPSNVRLVKSFAIPRMISVCSESPGPLTAPVFVTLGAMVAMRVNSAMGDAFSSMKSRVISECASIE